MKALALLLLASVCSANSYFKVVDPSHPKPVAGAMLAPNKLSETSAAVLVPIFTHSPNDGCILPNFVCEDWTPLAVGASMSSGKVTLDVAPLANVLPWMSGLALKVLPDSWVAARSIVAPSIDGSVTFSAGPVWEYRQLENKGYFRVFTGLALHF